MKSYYNLKNLIIFILVFPVWTASFVGLYEDRQKIQNKIESFLSDLGGQEEVVEESDITPLDYSKTNEVIKEADQYWAEELMKGGYILHFRHAERDKWIDVHMYDALESEVHENGYNESRYAEFDYFKEAVCLNERGVVQATAMGELLRDISFPIGYIISSPSCRGRQTAEFAFGGYDELDKTLIHRGAFNEREDNHYKALKELYLNLPMEPGKNTIVSSHNSVIHHNMFDSSVLPEGDDYKLEEGGFYVISIKDGKLILEHRFYYFKSFILNFYPREY